MDIIDSLSIDNDIISMILIHDIILLLIWMLKINPCSLLAGLLNSWTFRRAREVMVFAISIMSDQQFTFDIGSGDGSNPNLKVEIYD